MSSSSPHKAQPAPSPKFSFLDLMDDGRVVDWLSAHGKTILYILAALLALIVIVYRLVVGFGGKPEQEYLQAASDFAYFTKASETKDNALVKDAYERLKSLMAKHPELHAAYDGAIAQTFLIRDLVNDAQPYATATLTRTQSDALPFYGDYTTTTLLISEQKFQEALDKALILQKAMSNALASQTQAAKLAFGEELFALNLLRIAILQQEVGDKTAELHTWQEWKQYAGLESAKAPLTKIDPQAFRVVIQQLAVGAISLPDYIAYREKQLKK